MADTGLLFPGSVSQTAVGGGIVSWSNISNILTDNGLNAEVSLGDFQEAEFLQVTNFGVSIPTGDSILGIRVALQEDGSFGSGSGCSAILTKDGTSGVGTASYWSGSGIVLLGGATNLWGTTWTEAEVEASTFGVILYAYGGDPGSMTSSLDYLAVQIWHGAAPPPAAGTISTPSFTTFPKPKLRR